MTRRDRAARAFGFAFAVFIVVVCSLEWAGHPETYAHPDNHVGARK